MTALRVTHLIAYMKTEQGVKYQLKQSWFLNNINLKDKVLEEVDFGIQSKKKQKKTAHKKTANTCHIDLVGN